MNDYWQIGDELIPKNPRDDLWGRVADLFEQVADACEEIERLFLGAKGPIGEGEAAEILDAAKKFIGDTDGD